VTRNADLPPHRLQTIDGDWHELESKALRRENERKEKEAKRAAAKESGGNPAPPSSRDGKDRKRPNETTTESQRDAKRPHVDGGASQQTNAGPTLGQG
jgi:CTD kinase subunit alpha